MLICEFAKIRGALFFIFIFWGVLIIKILLYRVLY